jgi:hypothetical protein
VIGNSQSEARIGSFIFRADPSLRLVPDYSPLGRRNSHYADWSRIRPRNGTPARTGLRPILSILPLRGRIRADFGLVRVLGKIENSDLAIVRIPIRNIRVSLLAFSFPYINLNNDMIWFLLFRLFERGRIQRLECVWNSKIEPALLKLRSYYRE